MIKKKLTLLFLVNFLALYGIEKVEFKDFAMAKYELTKDEYNAYANKIKKKRLDPSDDSSDEPATNIDYKSAQSACHFYGGRLPTNREWTEVASIKSRASLCYEHLKLGSKHTFPTSEYPLKENSPLALCLAGKDDEFEATLFGSELLSVDESLENINGTYGMLGNVWEWTDSDIIKFNKQYKIIKGGSFANYSKPKLFSSKIVNFLSPDISSPIVGFRCLWHKAKE